MKDLTKAMILAAGLGTRLDPITKDIPKCMVPAAGKPLVEHQIDWLKNYGITEIAINLHYLHKKVTKYLGDGSKLGVKITYSIEDKLMGTAGGVKKLEKFFDSQFLVFYGDEYTDMNLNELKSYHDSEKAAATICIREDPPDVKATNIITLNEEHRITEFIEKPSDEIIENFKGKSITNCGIYICEPEILKAMPSNKFYDFGYNVFPELVKKEKVCGFFIPKKYFWCELGTIERYNKYKNLNKR